MSDGEDTLAFQLRALGITFARQLRLTPDRRWTADFGILTDSGNDFFVEVEGGQYSGGHKRGKAADSDYEKFNWCAMNGVCVLRFSTAMVEDGRAIKVIEEELAR